MRTSTAFSLLLASALALPITLTAQDFERPPGWNVRFDQAGASEGQLEMFVAMPPGWHVTSGPAAIYWDPEWEATGHFRVDMEVYLFDPGQRREAFGIFIGGRELEGDDQSYTYFLIREGGEFIVKRREGPDAPTLQPWTRHQAVRGYADRGDDVSVLNVLTVEATDRVLRFLINGEEVWSGDRRMLPVDGTYGFRVNHGLNLHVSRLEMRPLQ